MDNVSKESLYSDEELYVGIDVYKRTYSVSVVLEGELVNKWRTFAVPKQLVAQLKHYFPKATLYSAYEAGFSGFILHRALETSGIKILLSMHPVLKRVVIIVLRRINGTL